MRGSLACGGGQQQQPDHHISAAKHRPYSGKVAARKSVIGNKEKN
jgi:hypothetical protein